MTLDPLAHQADQRPDHLALVAQQGELTWSELDQQADQLAGHLLGAGLRPGATIATLVLDGPRAVLLLHAITRAGCTIAPLHPGWTEREHVTYLDLVRPDLVVCDQQTEDLAALVVQAPPLLTLEDRSRSRAMPAWDLPTSDQAPPGPRPEAVHSLIATSGTSGTPRAAELRLEAHLAIAKATAKRLRLTDDDRWLYTLSMAHVGGMATALRSAVTGAPLIHAGPFDPARFNELIDDGQITHASLVPTMLHQALEARGDRSAPGTLGCLLLGGAATPKALLARCEELGFPVAVTYGQTETTSQIATAPPELVARKPGTVGPPIEPVELRIDSDGSGQTGQILVRGPTLLAGYRGQEQAPVDEDGWLHTGDLGHLDEGGHLWVTGRESQRIVTGGSTVDPTEVEEALLAHVDVEQAAVVGIRDPEWGERVAAAVVLYDDAEADGQALKEACRDRLASAKLPRAFAFVDQLPTNANGKVDRQAIRELFET